jgi:NAD(P)-dependent dehydrogenase (short-subunit alcohol dehydrogenase family)
MPTDSRKEREDAVVSQRIWVIGGSSGIGWATAERCRQRGWDVVVADRVAPPHGLPYQPIDVADPASVRTAAQRAGVLNGLVCAAGIQIASPIETMADADIVRQIAVNLTGMVYCLKYFGPHLAPNASVVLVGSELAFVATAESPVYSATKGGVVALARSMAIAWRERGIRVNSLCPGATDTPLLRAVWNAKADPAQAEAQDTAAIPLGRLGRPEEIARAAEFLLAEDSSFVTGHALVVDGGTIAW